MDNDNPGDNLKSDSNNIIIEEKISKSNGEISIKRYTRGRVLGKGGFAKCYEVTNIETKKIYAGKIISKATLTKNRSRQKLISEIKIHKSLHQVFIVQFEHVFEDHENVYILLELCSNQSLNELIKRRKRLTEIEVQCYIVQIINAIKYLHSCKVIHRDLKLGNLLLNDKMEIKLCDFGLATKIDFEGEKKRTICGTPNYIAPEVLDGKAGHSYEVDVWSLGVIIYTFIIGKPPFETPEVKTTYKKIRQNCYGFPDHVPISENAKHIITQILHVDPLKRPTLDELLQHPFLNCVDRIPKNMPLSTLACPPSASYIKQFQPQGNTLRVAQQPQRLSETSHSNQPLSSKLTKNSSELASTTNNFNPPLQNNNNDNKQNFGSTVGSQPNFNSITDKGFSQTKTDNFKQSGSKTMGSSTALNTNEKKKSISEASKSETWVKQWVDYSTKYGLGYLLSNGSAGVFFNDSTKIILDPSGFYIEYLERKTSERQDQTTYYTMKDYPKELQKKITLLQHFRSYLEGEKQKKEEIKEKQQNGMIYIKKWMKTKHAIMFRLSNKIVQVNFTDKTEILLSSEQKMVTYVNKKGDRTNFPLATALESSNTEMAKRLKYTKEILTHMLNNNNNNANAIKADKENY